MSSTIHVFFSTNEAEHEKLKKRWMEENKVFFK